MLRIPKLQKRASDPEELKMGVPKIPPSPNFFGFEVTRPWAQNGECKKHNPMWAP